MEHSDLYPEAFLHHIWTGRYSSQEKIKEHSKAIGFKSFPDHWTDANNTQVWEKEIMDDPRVKKIALVREDELAVYISMKRAEISGSYMTRSYPKDLKIHVDPAAFQTFVNNYWDTYRRRYHSTFAKQDTFWISYEQLIEQEKFEKDILPLLWKFLGVDESQPLKKLRETVKQAPVHEDFSQVISNYNELEFAFRHTSVKHFCDKMKKLKEAFPDDDKKTEYKSLRTTDQKQNEASHPEKESWSLLLPICSRARLSKKNPLSETEQEKLAEPFNKNRLTHVSVSSQHQHNATFDETSCWDLLESFANSLKATSSVPQLEETECIVGIDIDDVIFNNQQERIRNLLPCSVVFVPIVPEMYGKVCKIWNHLAQKAKNDYILLLGDDIVLRDNLWQVKIANKFHQVAKSTGLPLGAACIALNDESFPGFPTFPVIHRWHMDHFHSLLPKQFVNQGGDPFLFELYSRFGASRFAVDCKLRNTIGGDGDARYKKHEINWKGQILRLNLMQLKEHLKLQPRGICLDVVVPSYRTQNVEILKSIVTLACSRPAYIKFWIVVDNPDPQHLLKVSNLAKSINCERFQSHGNYFVNVLSYGENRGASYARNFGYNYSTADFVLFLDDDVIPSRHILDAYVGAISRYPDAKVFVGSTKLPTATNTWTKMLRTCNIMFFYTIADHMTHPPWGVTANLMVRGSRHNHTIQFSHKYPKTGGGEDIDFCFQFREWQAYKKYGERMVVSVPGATALHPWWHNGQVCYSQTNGWAWGDSLCLVEWPQKTFRAFPNWIETIVMLLLYVVVFSNDWNQFFRASMAIVVVEYMVLTVQYFPQATRHVQGGLIKKVWVAIGAGSIRSSQEITRVVAHLYRGHWSCFSLRMDWNNGQNPRAKLDVQVRSLFHFVLYTTAIVLSWAGTGQQSASNYCFKEHK